MGENMCVISGGRRSTRVVVVGLDYMDVWAFTVREGCNGTSRQIWPANSLNNRCHIDEKRWYSGTWFIHSDSCRQNPFVNWSKISTEHGPDVMKLFRNHYTGIPEQIGYQRNRELELELILAFYIEWKRNETSSMTFTYITLDTVICLSARWVC